MLSLGDCMKENYENITRYKLPRRTHTIVRVDGKAFHSFTRGCEKPFDHRIMAAMANTAREMCAHMQGAKFAYVQSDEISVLLTDYENLGTDAWFDANLQKIVSISASLATAAFNRFYPGDKTALFDSRAFTIPEAEEVLNYFIWRQKDWERNSLNMLHRASIPISSYRARVMRNCMT